MRCPRCRKEIGFEQTTHAACGWRAGTAAPGTPEARHAKEDAARATVEQVEGHMVKIGEILKTSKGCKTARNLSVEERHGGSKLSGEERSLLKTQEQYDAEVARLKVEDQARASKLARLRKIAEAL